VSVKGRNVTVTGAKGSITTDFSHTNAKLKIVDTETHGKKLVVRLMNRTTKSGAVVRSVVSTVKKMMTGVKQGYRYKVRLVYAHFPINAKITKCNNVDNKVVEIRNFLGEKIVRRCEMIGEHTFVKMGDLRDELWIEGIDLRDVSQSGNFFFSFFFLVNINNL